MPVPAMAKKTASKRAPKKPGVTQLVSEFVLTRETPGTFRLDETAEKDDQIIGGLYLKKGPLEGTKPGLVRVTVEILETVESK